MKILVADPDPVSTTMMLRSIEKSGHELVLANNTAEAVTVMKGPNPPEMVLIDTSSWGMDCGEFCRHLREATGDSMPYLVAFGCPRKSNNSEGLLDGPDDYFPKPLDPVILAARLQTAFRLLDLQKRCAHCQDAEPDHDALTGAWGRRAIVECLRAQFARSSRDGVSLAVILGDMDYFYAANAKHGQAACDAVLRETARRIAGAIRPYDTLGRYSGEEFMIVAPDCTMSAAQGIAERLRSAVSDRPFNVGGRRITATISFGVATTAETGPLDQDGLLRSVDAALLSAKERGRNRVETAKRILRPRAPHVRVSSSTKPRELVQ